MESALFVRFMRVYFYPLLFLNRGRSLRDSVIVYEDPAPVDEVLCPSDAQALQFAGHAPGQAKAAGGAIYAEADGWGAKDVLFQHGLLVFSSLVETVPSCGR